MVPGTIVILNGTSSSGKSSLCRAFQQMMPDAYMHIDVDVMAKMMPDAYFKVEEALYWLLAHRFVSGVHRAVCAFAATGHHVILDQIVVRHTSMVQMLDIYADFPVYFVALVCSLEELERRERQREDRQIGLARRQSAGIHLNKVYDLELDTGKFPIESCAQQLMTFVQSGRPPEAFNRLRKKLAMGELIGKED